MKTLAIALAHALLLACLSAASANPLAAELASHVDPDTAARQIVIAIHQPRRATVRPVAGSGRPYLRRRAYRATPKTERLLDAIARDHALTRVEGWPIRSLEVYCEVLELPAGTEADDILAALQADPRVELAQPMNVFETLSVGYDDPYLQLQSAIQVLGIEAAHRIATGRGIRVAVIDSAVDIEHPDLQKSIRLSRDFVDDRRRSPAGDLHGTAVAGVIGSVANNSEGIVGIAPDAKLLALRACWQLSKQESSARCSTFTLAQAIEAALHLRPDILNLSLTGPPDPLLERLLAKAAERRIIVVAAVAEGDDVAGRFPASIDGVIAAARIGGPAPARPAGSEYRVTAPGTDILTTIPGAAYAYLSGSSLAAAHVSGLIALLLEHDRNLSTARAVKLLNESALLHRGLAVVNACAALARLTAAAGCATSVTQEEPALAKFR